MLEAVKPCPQARPGMSGLVLVVGLLGLSGFTAPAWALYKVVGPDGKITYTDRAPADPSAQAIKANGASSAAEGLPYELQRIASKYPVTLYTSKNCAACDSGRQMLTARGIPFAEKTVITNDDIKAFSLIDSTGQIPLLRIGGKQITGFSTNEWSAYLDAAGYPAKSMLPLNYRQAQATPLVPIKEAKPAEDVRQPSTSRPESLPTEPGGNPAGIRF
jgi:glutaredoxin